MEGVLNHHHIQYVFGVSLYLTDSPPRALYAALE